MYRLSGRQILVIALGSALFAAIAVAGFQQLSGHFQPFGSASISTPANITDPSMASDEQNNIEVYKASSPGVVYIQSTTLVRDFFGLFSHPVEGAGSGSIIDEQGDILTNYPVVARPEMRTVSFASCKASAASVIGCAP